MSYTNVELIKHHFDKPFPVADKVYDQQVCMYGEDFITFFGGTVEESSAVVKSIKEHAPRKVAIELSDDITVISSMPIVPGSLVVASDSSMGLICEENKDYVVDYSNGKLIIKDGGYLTPGCTLTVWYVSYHVYSPGDDYRLEESSGKIRRVISGDIADGERVYLDYSPVYSNVTDDVLSYAVMEANGIIEKTIDPDRQFGANPVLQTAATYSALEIVCRSSAMRELSGGRNNDRAALVWMKLADRYAELGSKMLADFKQLPPEPTQPTHS